MFSSRRPHGKRCNEHVKQLLGDLLSGARSEGGTREQLFGAGWFQGRLCVSSNQTWNIHLRFFSSRNSSPLHQYRTRRIFSFVGPKPTEYCSEHVNRQHKKSKYASSALQRIIAWSIVKPKGGHELSCWFDKPFSMTTLCPIHNQANLDPWFSPQHSELVLRMKEIGQRRAVHRFSQFMCLCVNFDVHAMLKRFHLWAWLGGFLREMNQCMSATARVP